MQHPMNHRRDWPASFRVLMALLIALFVFETSVVQTHVHGLGGHETVAATKVLGHTSGQFTAPAATCELCKALAAGGHTLPPEPGPLLIGLVFGPEIFAPALSTTAVLQRSHAWQSRAPPAISEI